MKRLFGLVSISLLLFSCQPRLPAITIIDGDRNQAISAAANTPAEILAQAGISISASDRLLVNGMPASVGQPLNSSARSLQIRRAVGVNLVTSEGEQSLLTSAPTVGEALHEAGFPLHAVDFLDPVSGAPIRAGMTITYRPSQEFTVATGAGDAHIRSSAETVGAALAEAGIPLVGLDRSLPPETAALPMDGQVHIVRVNEALQVAQKSIPYDTETVSSPEVALGEQKILQPGKEGLAMTRARIRYEDGQEVSRLNEAESMVLPPQNRIIQTGTKVVVSTDSVNGETLDYWRVMEMYATVYSPCNSGTGGCSYGTASGLKAGRGVVAVDPSLYGYLQGQRVYIPGYGFAVIGDVGGGYIVEQMLGVSRYRWIDLGFDDDNIVDMTGWVTVYFLAPAPATIPPALQ